MFFSLLSKLSDEFPDLVISSVDNYLKCLSPSAQTMITVSKLSDALQIDSYAAANILKRCVDIGLLRKAYGIKCPTCGMLLAEIDSLIDSSTNPPYCSSCERDIIPDEIDYANDVILLFSLNPPVPPFENGQQSNPPALSASDGSVVPKADTLGSGVHYRLVTNNDLFHPTDEMYVVLEKSLEIVKQRHKNATEQGMSLERFVCMLFSQCVIFRATVKHRSQANTSI